MITRHKMPYLVTILITLLSTILLGGCGQTPSESTIVEKQTLNVTVQGNGTVNPSGQHEYEKHSIVELSVTPAESWKFLKWAGDNAEDVADNKILMDSNKTLIAVFVPREYELTLASSGSGHIDEEIIEQTPKSAYAHGTKVQITAQADIGWRFDHWEGAAAGMPNPTTLTILGPSEVKAVFIRRTYPLTVDKTGEGVVNETVVESPKSTSHEYGTKVELTATPEVGWKFDHWVGDVTGSASPIVITITKPMSVSAIFVKQTFDVTTTPEGNGTIQLSPSPTINNPIEYGTTVEFTANASSGWRFDHWEGDITGNTNPKSITVTNAISVKAVFIQESYTLTTNTAGGGTVSASPSGTGDLGNEYPSYSQLWLTATPGAGMRFFCWQGDIKNSANPYHLTLDSNKSVTAVFRESDYAGYDVGRSYVYTLTSNGQTQTGTQRVESGAISPTGAPEFRMSNGDLITYIDGKYYRIGSWSNIGGYTETRKPTAELMFTHPVKAGDLGPDGSIAIEIEEVTVPAGRFNAWRYDFDANGTTASLWFTEKYGIVKIQQPGWTYELTSYTP